MTWRVASTVYNIWLSALWTSRRYRRALLVLGEELVFVRMDVRIDGEAGVALCTSNDNVLLFPLYDLATSMDVAPFPYDWDDLLALYEDSVEVIKLNSHFVLILCILWNDMECDWSRWSIHSTVPFAIVDPFPNRIRWSPSVVRSSRSDALVFYNA